MTGVAGSKLRKAAQLSREEWLCLVQALFLLPWSAILLRARGYRYALEAFVTPGETSPEFSDSTGVSLARSISRMVDAAARYGPYRAGCLSRSLVLIHLMRKRGLTGRLVLGARRAEEEFVAHAWVECRGVVINDDSDAAGQYKAFNPSNGTTP